MKYIVRIAEAVLIAIFANIFLIGNIIPVSRIIWLSMVLLLMTLFVVVNIVPCYASWKLKSPRLRNNADGCELLEIFLISAGISIVINVYWWFLVLPAESPWVWTACVGSAICCMMVEAVVFWNGMIRIYITSVQLGMKWRIIGALCGMIPVVHLIVLGIMIGIVREEIRVENDKLLLDQGRRPGGSAGQNIRCCWYMVCFSGIQETLITGDAFRLSWRQTAPHFIMEIMDPRHR